jgi:hypothetical protein
MSKFKKLELRKVESLKFLVKEGKITLEHASNVSKMLFNDV